MSPEEEGEELDSPEPTLPLSKFVATLITITLFVEHELDPELPRKEPQSQHEQLLIFKKIEIPLKGRE